MTTQAMTHSNLRAPSKAVNISLWIVQILLGAMFGMAGFMKLSEPMEALTQQMGWPGAVPEALVRFIGLSEFAGALGLILPSVTRIRPRLTPLAAAGLVVVMILASGFHLIRGELQAIPINFVLGALAGFVAWGRSKRAPIEARE